MSITATTGAGVAAGMAAMLRLPLSGALFGLLMMGAPGLDATPVVIVAATVAYVADLALEKVGGQGEPRDAGQVDLTPLPS